MAGVGGGHSGGGGIGHGGGGSFGGGHHGGGGIGGGHHGGSFGGGHGGFGGGFHGGHHGPHGNHNPHRPHSHHSGGWFFGGPGPHGPRRHSSGCGGLLVVPIIFIFLLVFMSSFLFQSNITDKIGADNYITEIVSWDTEETLRKELPVEYCKPIDAYFTDELDLLEGDTSGQVTELMQAFHEMSGIQPHLYITDNLFGDPDPDSDTIEKWLYETYYKLFGDEGHFLLLYLTDLQAEVYQTWYVYGDDTTMVFEPYEWDDLLYYIDENYAYCSTYEEMFAQSFNDMIVAYESDFADETVTEAATFTTVLAEPASTSALGVDESEALMTTEAVISQVPDSVVTDIFVTDLIIALLVLIAVVAIVFIRKKNSTVDNGVNNSSYKEPWE